MKKDYITINSIPVIVWGEPSDKVYLYVHGKGGSKELAEGFAVKAIKNGYQVISFDLPKHGDRHINDYDCDIIEGVNDLNVIYEYTKNHWKHIGLYANSLGAYFSLVCFQDIVFDRCLFSAPLLDMKHLIENMMTWFNVTEEQLEKEQYIDTPSGEPLIWDYYKYVLAHPILKWNTPTYILWGTKDTISEKCVVDDFVSRFNAEVTVIQDGEHYIQNPEHKTIKEKWLDSKIV